MIPETIEPWAAVVLVPWTSHVMALPLAAATAVSVAAFLTSAAYSGKSGLPLRPWARRLMKTTSPSQAWRLGALLVVATGAAAWEVCGELLYSPAAAAGSIDRGGEGGGGGGGGGDLSDSNKRWLRVVGVAASYFFFELLVLDVLLTMPTALARLPRTTPNLRAMYKGGLTRIILISLCASSLHRQQHHPPSSPGTTTTTVPPRGLEDLYGATACGAWGAFVAFHAVLLADRGAHVRLAAHVGLPLPAFTALNLAVVHGGPCAVAARHPPDFRPWHGLAAAAAALVWGALTTGGTFRLDHVYVPCRPAVWRCLFAVFVAVAALVPLLFS